MFQPPHTGYRSIAATAICLCAGVSSMAEAREITCYSAEFPPYVISREQAVSGIDVEVVAEAGRRAGMVVNVKLLPWVRLENELKKGAASEVECAFAYSKNAARTRYMDFTDVPMKQTSYVLFAKKGTLANYRGVLELQGKTIGLRRGFIVPGVLEEMRRENKLTIDETDSDIANFTKLDKGRIDGILTNAEVGHATLQQLQLSSIIAIEPAIEKIPTYLVFNKQKNLSTELSSFNKALKEIMADGTARKIRNKYLHLPAGGQ
jgi:polar amino acid transport system substrate-binding protein